MDDRCPKIKLGIMVGAWAGGPPDNWEDVSQFDNLFPEDGFDFDKITKNAERLEFVHGDDDTYCPVSQSKWLAEQTNSPIHIIERGGHLGRQFKELPVIMDIIGG
jgi:predicted alpha/beta hydrolase family esterase